MTGATDADPRTHPAYALALEDILDAVRAVKLAALSFDTIEAPNCGSAYGVAAGMEKEINRMLDGILLRRHGRRG